MTRLALVASLCFAACTSTQLAAARAALSTCATPAAEAELANLLPVLTAVVTSQPVNSEAIVTSLEQVSLTGTICSLQLLANSAPTPAAGAQLRLAGVPGFDRTTAQQAAFAAKLLASRTQ